jgi:hypothetical protein
MLQKDRATSEGGVPWRESRVYLLSASLVFGPVGLAAAQRDVADIPSRQLSVAEDPNLSYFLIGPVAKETPAEGYGLIVVLPGGDGKADSAAYFIEHSPQDKVCPFRMAEEAVCMLTAAGAKVKFNQ